MSPTTAVDGTSKARPNEAEPIRRRTFDDLYRLGRDRHLGLVGPDGASLTVQFGRGYPYAEVWVPASRPFVALEPMTSSINSLGAGTALLVAPGDSFRATFALALGAPS